MLCFLFLLYIHEVVVHIHCFACRYADVSIPCCEESILSPLSGGIHMLVNQKEMYGFISVNSILYQLFINKREYHSLFKLLFCSKIQN